MPSGINPTSQIFNEPWVDSRTFDFRPRTPGVTLTGGIQATITLAKVPLGVNGADLRHYLYISGGSGAPERVLITGGTAVSDGATGTIIFTPANNHSGAWTISSASAGILEAVSFLGRTGTIKLPAGTLNINCSLVIPTNISLIGAGARATILNCIGSVSPALVVADDTSGLAPGSGLGQIRDLYLQGVAGSGIWIGGDPNNVFAPSTWLGNYARFVNVLCVGFVNALTCYWGNFILFDGCVFSATSRALLIPANAAGAPQPGEFRNCVLTVPSGAAIEMQTSAFLSSPLHFVGGQISGTIIGADIDIDAEGVHFEPNSTDTPILNATGGRFRASGGIMGTHQTGPNSLATALAMNGTTAECHLNVKDVWYQTSNAPTTNFVSFGTNAVGSLTLANIDTTSTPSFTNLYAITANPLVVAYSIRQGIIPFNKPVAAAAATLVFPQLDLPVSQTLQITGGTVGGSGITAVSGLMQRQSGTLVTDSPQTFTAGATIGNTLTTSINIPVTFFFDGTKIWLK